MTTVEQALAASRKAMTILEIGAATGIDPSEINDHLRAISDAGNLEYIPARGHHAKSYALKRIPAATADSPAGGGVSNAGSAESASSAEVRAVATENPGPDAGPPPSSAEGSGGDVDHASGRDCNPGLEMSVMRAELERLKKIETECNGWIEMVGELNAELNAVLATATAINEPAGFLLIVPKRKPRVFKTHGKSQGKTQGMARAMALSAVRNGAKRAEVFALVPDGFAKTVAEWREL